MCFVTQAIKGRTKHMNAIATDNTVKICLWCQTRFIHHVSSISVILNEAIHGMNGAHKLAPWSNVGWLKNDVSFDITENDEFVVTIYGWGAPPGLPQRLPPRLPPPLCGVIGYCTLQDIAYRLDPRGRY